MNEVWCMIAGFVLAIAPATWAGLKWGELRCQVKFERGFSEGWRAAVKDIAEG